MLVAANSMIPGSALYHVAEAMAPLYTAAALGYASVRWLGAFSDEQCAGINHFVALYALPLLIFHMVSTNDPYRMNARLVAADTPQKAIVLLALLLLAAWWALRRRSDRGGVIAGDNKPAPPPALRWVVSGFSVATLPNTIIMGVPLLRGMYGEVSAGIMKQVVVLQFGFWYNVVIFFYEYMAAREGIAPANKISPAEQQSHRHEVDVEVTKVVAGGRVLTVEDCQEAKEFVVPVQQVPLVMHVVRKAGKRLLKVPNTYASVLGMVWSLIAVKAGIKMPKIVDGSLSIIYTAAVGLSMFSSGTFIARQSRFVPCGYKLASLSMVLRFLIGPVAMLLASLAVGLHDTLLHVAVVQAALPLAVTSFVYAEEYKVHADIMSTGVILGIFISLPVTIVYYILLGL